MHLPSPYTSVPSQAPTMPPQHIHQRDISSCPPSVRAPSPSLALARAHSHMSKFYAVRGKSAPPFPSSLKRPTLPSLREALAYPLSPSSDFDMKMDPIDRLLKPLSTIPKVFLDDEIAKVGAMRGSISPRHHLIMLEKLRKEYPLVKKLEAKEEDVSHDTRVPADEDMEEEEKKGDGEDGKEHGLPDLRMKCHCGRSSLGSSTIIPCPTCPFWSHISCYDYDVLDPMLVFQCYACQPRFVRMEEKDLFADLRNQIGEGKKEKEDVELKDNGRGGRESSPLSDLPASESSTLSSLSIGSRASSPLSSLSGTAFTSEPDFVFDQREVGDGDGDSEDGEYEMEGEEGRNDSFEPVAFNEPISSFSTSSSSSKRKRAPPSPSSSILCRKSNKRTRRNAPSPSPHPHPHTAIGQEEIYHVGTEDRRLVKEDGSIVYLTRDAFIEEAKAIFDRGVLDLIKAQEAKLTVEEKKKQPKVVKITAEVKNTSNTTTITCRNGRKHATGCPWKMQVVAPAPAPAATNGRTKLCEAEKTWTIKTSRLVHNEDCRGRVPVKTKEKGEEGESAATAAASDGIEMEKSQEKKKKRSQEQKRSQEKKTLQEKKQPPRLSKGTLKTAAVAVKAAAAAAIPPLSKTQKKEQAPKRQPRIFFKQQARATVSSFAASSSPPAWSPSRSIIRASVPSSDAGSSDLSSLSSSSSSSCGSSPSSSEGDVLPGSMWSGEWDSVRTSRPVSSMRNTK